MAGRSKQPVDRVPRAIIHKNILDAAEDDPQASVEAIADEVGGATPELVTSVLEEYGDPASDGTTEPANDGGADGDSDETMTTSEPTDEATSTGGATADSGAESDDEGDDGAENDESARETVDGDGSAGQTASDENEDSTVDRDGLTPGQLETLRTIHRRPDATQKQIAEGLGVVRATVSNRVNDIDGFDWQHRRRFVEAFFDATVGTAAEAAKDSSNGTNSSDGETTVDGTTESIDENAAIRERLEKLEAAVAALETTVVSNAGDERATPSNAGEETTADLDPELLHRAATAILEADQVDEEEAIRLLRHLL